MGRESWGELEHRSQAGIASPVGGAVEVARRVPDQSSDDDGICSVRSSNAVQHVLHAGRIQPEHRSLAGSAAHNGGAVEVAHGAPDQTCEGILSVTPSEAVEHGLLTVRIQLEHCSAVTKS